MTAVKALADAARARSVPDARPAAEALVQAAGAMGRNVEPVRRAWLTEQARQLRDES
ncbi:hypothetical protein [Streptomyces sp. NPDC002133]|uniref:hypothetical protein n=1 Tax=Streptomyces sp. NPDC002133 TaxID=3154409 RepID=UPI0033229C60